MPYSFPDRVAVASSPIPTPMGLIKADVTPPDVSDFPGIAFFQSARLTYTDTAVVAYQKNELLSGGLFDPYTRSFRTIGLRPDSNALNFFETEQLPAADTIVESPGNFPYWDGAVHDAFFDPPTFYLNVHFAYCYYIPWEMGPLETAGTISAHPGRLGEEYSVIGSYLGNPHTYQFQYAFRGPGPGFSCIKPFRRQEASGGDIDGSKFRMIGVWGTTDGTPRSRFVNLFDFPDTFAVTQCTIEAAHSSELRTDCTALGYFTYEEELVEGEGPVTVYEKFVTIFTPDDLYTTSGSDFEDEFFVADLNPTDSEIFSPKLQNLDGVGFIDLTDYQWVGFPGGFYGFKPFDTDRFYVVDPLWTEYTCYQIIENDQDGCDTINAFTLNLTRTNDGEWIFYKGLGDGTFVQLIEGPAAPEWTGCAGVEPPTGAKAQFTSSIQYGLEPSNIYEVSPYRPPRV